MLVLQVLQVQQLEGPASFRQHNKTFNLGKIFLPEEWCLQWSSLVLSLVTQDTYCNQAHRSQYIAIKPEPSLKTDEPANCSKIKVNSFLLIYWSGLLSVFGQSLRCLKHAFLFLSKVPSPSISALAFFVLLTIFLICGVHLFSVST